MWRAGQVQVLRRTTHVRESPGQDSRMRCEESTTKQTPPQEVPEVQIKPTLWRQPELLIHPNPDTKGDGRRKRESRDGNCLRKPGHDNHIGITNTHEGRQRRRERTTGRETLPEPTIGGQRKKTVVGGGRTGRKKGI